MKKFFNLILLPLALSLILHLPLSAEIYRLDSSSRSVCVVLEQKNLVVDARENPAAGELWAYVHLPPAANAQTPLVLVLPILGGQNLWIEKKFALALNKREIATAIIPFPQQFERRRFIELSSGKLFLERDPSKLALNFKQALVDISSFLDWIENGGSERISAGWKPKKFGLWGTSLGAIVGSVAMSRDPRLSAGVFVLAGTDLATILYEGSETRKVASKIKTSRQEVSSILREFDLYEIARRTPACELWQNRPILIVEGIWDRVIPKNSRKKILEAIPHARLLKIPAGHYTALLHMFWVKGKVARFLEENLQ